MTQAQIDNIFVFHPPSLIERDGKPQIHRYAEIREGCRVLATLIKQLTPESGEQTLAIRAVQDAMMRANAAIAINEG